MEKARAHYIGITWRLVVAALLPFVVYSCYLFFSRWPARWFTGASDWVGFIISVMAGSAFIVTLPIRPGFRIASLFLYFFTFCAILFFYGFWFVGTFFGDWL